MREGRPPIILFSAVLFVVCGLAMLAVGVSSISLPHDADPAAAKAILLNDLRANYNLPLPPDTAIVRYENRSGRDARVWALLRVRPDLVRKIREAIVARSTSRGWTLDDNDSQTPGSALGLAEPDWWTPSALVDPDVLMIKRGKGLFVILSAKTGSIYLLTWNV